MFAPQLVSRPYLQSAVRVGWPKSNHGRVQTPVQKGRLLLCTLLEAESRCETKAPAEISHRRTGPVLEGTVVRRCMGSHAQGPRGRVTQA
jgi:hypothetical protein